MTGSNKDGSGADSHGAYIKPKFIEREIKLFQLGGADEFLEAVKKEN